MSGYAINHTNYPGTGTPSDWQVANEPFGDYPSGGIAMGVNSGLPVRGVSVTLGDGTVVPVDIYLYGRGTGLYMLDSDHTKFVKDFEISAVFQQQLGAPGSNGYQIALSSNQAGTSIRTTGFEPFLNDLGSVAFFHDASPHLWWGTNDPSGGISLSVSGVSVTEFFSQPADLATGIPWGWLGNYFMSLEGHCAITTTGNTTARPVTWNLGIGVTTSDQIVKFETTTAQATWQMGGTITMTFHNPTTHLDEIHTVSFAI